VLPIDQLFVDIGAKDKDEALRHAPAGTPVTFDTP
jgi:putative aminopeptidase FrvX